MKRRVDLILKMLERKGEEEEIVNDKENVSSKMNVEVDDGTTIQQIKRIRTESGELEKESLNGEEIDSRSYTLLKNVEKCNVTTNYLLEPTQTADCRKSRSRSSSTSSSSSSRSSSSSSSASSNTSSSSSNSSSPEQHSSKLDAATPSSSPKPSSSKEHATPSASSPKPSTSKKHVDSSSPSSTPSKPHTTLSTSPSKPNYRISPINTDESDVYLSDSDPTFKLNNNTVNDASSSEFVSDSANIENTEKKKKTRKRLRNPSKWKQNVVKELRNTGKAYQSLSKTKKNISARSIKEKCNCKLKCGEKILDTDRLTLFNSFWKLSNLELQRAFIRSCMFEIKPKYKYTNAEKPRLPNNALYFTLDSNKIRVCKKFFLNTLDISDRQLRTVKSKTNSQGFVETDQRGKHNNRKQIDSTLLQDIRDHINSIPKIESHYLRATTDKEYISDSKTIKDLCYDFNKKQKENNRPECDYWLYINTFNKEFNIGFFQPKKDRCDTCIEYEMAPETRKIEMNYKKHLEEKNLCRLEKKNDRANINDFNICAVFDLQSVMLCPSPSYFYYSSKINCLDFTITELNSTQQEDHKAYGDVFCYFWDETQGNRAANEIGSCLFDYLKTLSSKHPDENLKIIFYSDNCTGQNKNKVIASLYSFAVIHFKNIQSITHKYFIKGHTQNEADNVHSLIEKEIKKNEKAGPIYTPYQYITIIKSARKSGKPFTVREMNHNCFFDLKQLQEQWAYNFNEDTKKIKSLGMISKSCNFSKKSRIHLGTKHHIPKLLSIQRICETKEKK